GTRILPKPKMSKQSILAAIFAAGIFSISAAAQKPDDVVRVDTALVSFEVTVTDKNGNPVKDLQPGDFKVIEDGSVRKADFFQPITKSNTSRPLSIVFALDVSGSMTPPELEKLKRAMQAFLDKLADYNSYFAVTAFGMTVKTLQPFTNRPDRLEKIFDKLGRDADGLSTHAYDAVDDAIRMIVRKSPPKLKEKFPRRAVILVTDGFPVGDLVSPTTVIERANQAETSVFSVLLPSFSRFQQNSKPLLTPLEVSGLIDQTGGKTFYATDKNFEALFKALAEEITSSYAIAFYPGEINRDDGRFHEVKIESTKGYLVKQNRLGYKGQR
ncbi:MAG: VWA domain-containing protein, partial [Pyrinomonadaceae bacterium]